MTGSGMRVVEMPRVAERDVREGTTGRRVSVLPRVWAVGVDPRPGAGRVQAKVSGGRPGTDGRTQRGEVDRGEGSERKRCEGRRAARVRSGHTEIVAAAAVSDEVAFYRKYTEAMLRRYQRLSLQAGRVPSPMDREIFRGRMSHYKVQGFDDAVIFCADVEKCMGRLNGEDQRLLRRIAVQEYTMGEAAGVLGMSLRSCIVLYRRALDRMTRLFLQFRLLEPEKSLSRGGGGLA